MKKLFATLIVLLAIIIVSCNSPKKENNDNTDKTFASFETKFLDAFGNNKCSKWFFHEFSLINFGLRKYKKSLSVIVK